MNKELPKMYHNKINKTVNSIQKVYSSMENHKNNELRQNKYSSISIDQKIEQIFKEKDFVYKADVEIITDTDTIKKRIVARNKNNLITIDNEYIPISITDLLICVCMLSLPQIPHFAFPSLPALVLPQSWFQPENRPYP